MLKAWSARLNCHVYHFLGKHTAASFDRVNMITNTSDVCKWVYACQSHRAIAEQTPKSVCAVEV